MAALCPGVQYGLSSQQNFSENKDLIFVKLTDSALRAIEDYIKNQNKCNFQSPRIRFLGNENGELSFPSQHHESGHTSFSFAMSTSADMEGPAGSFECIQGTPPRGPLESLGSIRYKIRVHANDDVYEATKNRMTEAEDKYKNKCTREIKPNQTDIGRKVKVKQTLSTSSSSLSSSRPPLLPSSQQPRPALPSMRDSLLKQPSYQNPSVVKPPPSTIQPSSHSSLSNGLSNGLGSNHVSSSQRSTVHHNRKPSVPEVARRPLRERLIQLLALRPFKKIELHDRLNKEGLRGQNSMSTILKQIAQMRDNCFYLNRNLWNEVNDDWPFYTEMEKQILKRRKPQNLTPPGGSDGGSSGSGQSPTSTHPGSPPLITSTYGVSGGAKRPGYNEGADGFPYKRQRIAHGGVKGTSLQSDYNNRQQNAPDPIYRQSDTTYNRSPVEQNNSQRRPATDLRDSSNMNPRSRESPPNGFFNSYDNLPPPEDDKKRQCDTSANGLTFGVSREKIFRSGSPVNSGLMTEEARRGTSSPILQSQAIANGVQRDKDRRNNNNNNHKVSSSSHRIARVSPDSQTEGMLMAPAPEKSPTPISHDSGVRDEIEFPDYKKLYIKITSPEQKRAYKAEFNADYDEYRNLYPIVEKVSRRFSQLEERLKQEGVNTPRYKDIKKQIVREYAEMKKDLVHQRAKSRFQYLHSKLSHIKKLVSEFEQAQQLTVKC